MKYRFWAIGGLVWMGFLTGCAPVLPQPYQGKLENAVGQQITLSGKAEDAKGGAVLVIQEGAKEEGVIYIRNLDSWKDDQQGKTCAVTGTLHLTQYLPVATQDENGLVTQGTNGGKQFVFDKATWECRMN